MEFRAIARLGRFKDVIASLLRHGFDDLVQRLDLPGMDLVRKWTHSDTHVGTYERIRHVLEDLGPTFVKFGQIMSLRPDLLPPPLIEELSRLQDDVATEEFSAIQQVVERELGRPLKEVFTIFDVTPLAGASLSQVHRGVLRKEGWIVSVKIQRPGIRKKIRTDLDILAAIAHRLHERSEELRFYDLPNLVRVTRRNLLRELDFKREARNMKIARSYAFDNPIHIPEPYEDYCTEGLLIMEYVQGTKLKDMDHSQLSEPQALAKQGLHTAIKQILEDGFFHADPHPGNMLIMDDNRLCLLDWGMVGRLTERNQRDLLDLLTAVVDRDSHGLAHALLQMSQGTRTIDLQALERDLLEALDTYYAVPLKDLNIGQLLLLITGLLREYQLKLPSDLVIMIKSLVTAEGTARLIYPELDVFTEARGYVRRLAFKRLEPRALWLRFRNTLSYLFFLQRDIPERLSQIVNKMESGELSIRFVHENLKGLRMTIENASSRMAFSIIIAALIIGSSMIITTGIGPLLFGFPALGVVGYIISGLLGLWLIFNIIRARRY
ncbi:MAG: ABC transporter [Deltaproteobacteria bacterium]|nr:ABC transporter [Deltaproteobacteria bacterium]